MSPRRADAAHFRPHPRLALRHRLAESLRRAVFELVMIVATPVVVVAYWARRVWRRGR